MAQTKRFDAVDFWRGIALVVIFVNHMPGNVLEAVTPRNFAFSDSAEAFVFMAGFAGALAYGGKLERGESAKALGALFRRVGLIYVVQIFITFLAMALYFSAFKWGGASDILSVHDRDVFLRHPLEGLIGSFLLTTQIGYYNILPMYVLFLAAAPLLLLIANRSIMVLTALSVAVYVAARITGLNAPTFPDPGVWFFNPFAWQLVYCLGLATGTLMRRGHALPKLNGFYSLAMSLVFLSAVIVSNGFGTMPDLFGNVGAYLDLDKTNLGLARLINFFALGYAIYCSTLSARLRAIPVYQPLVLMGRNSIWVFAVGSILSTIGQVLMEVMKNTILLDVSYALFGIAVLYLVALMAQGLRETAARPASASLAAVKFPR